MKQKQWVKKIRQCGLLILSIVLLGTALPVKAENIKISKIEYRAEIGDEFNLYLGNKKPVSGQIGSKVFITYTVDKVEIESPETALYGVLATQNYKETFPYLEDNVMWWGRNIPLLEQGCTYILRMERTEEGFTYRVAKLKGEDAEEFYFTNQSAGVIKDECTYYGLWMDGLKLKSASLSHIRCYDENGNDLGVDTNRKGAMQIFTIGEISDYSKSEAVYYCEEEESLIVLNTKKKAVKETNGVKETCNYQIRADEDRNSTLYLQFKSGKEAYDYRYTVLTDEDGKQYKRLRESKVTFVTGEETFSVKAEASNGYVVQEPEVPTKDGYTFKEWCLSNGNSFELGKIVTQSVTLYAKWVDAEGNEYIAGEGMGDSNDYLKLVGQGHVPMLISITASSVLIVACMLGCVLIGRRKKHEQKETD